MNFVGDTDEHVYDMLLVYAYPLPLSRPDDEVPRYIVTSWDLAPLRIEFELMLSVMIFDP